VSAGGSVGRDDLILIDGEDIRRSRLFDEVEVVGDTAACVNGKAPGG
jgi:hypothetical protein